MEGNDTTGHHPELPALMPVAGGHHRCVQCERIIYSDPKVAVAAIIPMGDGIVLLKRAIEPQIGEWSFPSGYVDRGEKLERALEREVLEECGLVVSVNQLIGVYSEVEQPVVLVVYHADVVSGQLVAGDETAEARIFELDAMPKLAFEHDDRIVSDWREGVEMRRIFGDSTAT